MKEEEFLHLLQVTFGIKTEGMVGIGDDCAVIPTPTGTVLVTTDAFAEGIHFPSWISPEDLLSRCITAALSDINAMGGRGTHLFLAAGLPVETLLEPLSTHLQPLLEAFGLKLSGGDTVKSEKIFLSLTLLGETPSGLRPILRSGARPGDTIYLSGSLGAPAAGFFLMEKGWKKESEGWRFGEQHPSRLQREALDAALTPVMPYPLGSELNRRRHATAAIDISDGFLLDLARLCRASGVGARVDVERIPVHPSAHALSLQQILSSGEEFALLFTSPLALDHPAVGTIIEEDGVALFHKGEPIEIKTRGFDHFE